MSQARDRKRFTISDVAADSHELIIPLRSMGSSIARISEPFYWTRTCFDLLWSTTSRQQVECERGVLKPLSTRTESLGRCWLQLQLHARRD